MSVLNKQTPLNAVQPIVSPITGEMEQLFREWMQKLVEDFNSGTQILAITDPITANYTVTKDDFLINVTTAGVTITLLTAVGIGGQAFEVKNSSGADIILNTTSSQTIDGLTSQVVPSLSAIKVASDGVNWLII